MNIVSFPRSGSTMTYLLLQEIYEQKNMEFSFCEFYTCCKSIPCKFNKIYQKNHDFKLNLEIKENEKYLILYRKDVIEQLEAWFRYTNRKNNFDYNNHEYYIKLLKFIKKKINYYKKFINKYVDVKRPNFLVIDYNDYLNNPENRVFDIFNFFNIKITKKEVGIFLENRKIKLKKRNTLCPKLRNKLIIDLF